MKNCRICKTPSPVFYNDSRTFFKCPACTLIFTEEMADEKAANEHYKNQWNNADEDFWKQQVDVLISVINKHKTPQRILDFGSGSGEITKEFQRRGIDTTPLDPIIHGYLKDQDYAEKFDVVVGVEVIEHLPEIYGELEEIKKVLTDDGIIVFTTGLTNVFIDAPDAVEVFAKWWYKDDPTHVSFFSNRSVFTMAGIAGLKAEVYGEQLFVLSIKG
ncbi:MAG: class I SAM-dependent methyltransferase [Nitrospinota bacterium]